MSDVDEIGDDDTIGAKLQRLFDERDIREVLATYCRAIDRMDRALLESVFHPDAMDDHVFYRGTSAGFIANLFDERLPRLRWTMHNIGASLIEVVGDVAHSETYGVAYHGRPLVEGREILLTIGVRYVDRFERRDGGSWRIADRVVVLEWKREEEIEDCRESASEAFVGCRDGRDALYVRGHLDYKWANPGAPT